MDKLPLTRSIAEFERAKTLIPGGVLGIRRPTNFVEGEYPIFFDHGQGGRVVDIDGNEYIDYLCAYGPIILGYREKEIDEAVYAQVRDKGFCFSLTQLYQNELAEKLNQLIPCAEMSLFVKTGSDATTCAVRLARGYSKKTKILRCGYHGWHDWCVEVKGGIPAKLYEDVYEFSYNDSDELEKLLQEHGTDTAAIIITPYGHPVGAPLQAPAEGYLQRVRELANQHNVVLIFDEIRTGFRLSLGGAQKYYGVTPDMAVFGKAMANGYAIGAICGRKEVMQAGEKDVFISSTFFPNSDAYIAALKTIEILQREKVLESIRQKGENLMTQVSRILAEYTHLGIEINGNGPMFFITFAPDGEKLYKQRRKEFYTGLIRRKIFQQPYHHGYVCYRHSDEDINYTVRAIKETVAELN